MDSQRDLPLESFKPTVQVYAVTNEATGEYELMGHGFLLVFTDQFEEESVHYIEVLKKTEGILLRSRMRLQNNFERQKGTVITWRDNEQKMHQELAISFEEDKQCDFFWYLRRLICEKIGQNYLDINGRDVLEMPNQGNLTIILDKTKTSKDMVEYHLLNSKEFVTSLSQVFKKFQGKNDKMGMGMVGRIMKSILTNLDHRLVENMFSDPSFQLILEVEKFNKNIDLLKSWAQRVKIKQILPLNEQLNNKILIYHRIAFYRENILDLMKETYFEHILVLAQTECCKDIINQFIKENLFEQLVEMSVHPFKIANVNMSKEHPEDETSANESEAIRKKALYEAKIDFLMETILTTKQIQSQNLKVRFLERLYKSQVIKMIIGIMDQNIPKALDFFACLVLVNPNKFLQYLKEKFREMPADNLHSKLAKRYCLGTEELQCSIIDIIKTLADCFKIKENLDFYIGTFFTYVFQCCKDEKALLMLMSQIQNVIENVESFFLQTVKSKVFTKIMPFLRNLTRDKISELRAIKVLKRILVENTQNKDFKLAFLKKINNQIINSGFFEYCMMLLSKNLHLNNIVSSSMLQNIKLIREMKHYSPYHQFIQLSYSNSEHLQKYISPLLTAKPQTQDSLDDGNHSSHFRQLEQQRQESYLMDENNQAIIDKEGIEDEIANKNLQELKRIRSQILREEQAKNELELNLQKIRKLRKESQAPLMCIEFHLDFDESLQGIE